MKGYQPFTKPHHLHLQDILEPRRQLVRRQCRREADRLFGFEKFSRGLAFVRAGMEKIGPSNGEDE